MFHKPKKIVIVGAGFGGLYAYLKLNHYIHAQEDEAVITLISDRDYFLFVPLLHEVATGNLAPNGITQPIRQLPYGCCHQFIEGRVTAIDFDKRKVAFRRTNEDSSAESQITYDYLVSAVGFQVNFFDTPGAEEYALTLKDLDDAKKIKNQVLSCFENAQTASAEEREQLLRFVIVGGGPTGIELAGELMDLLTDELKVAFPNLIPYCQIVMVQNGEKLVPQMQSWFSDQATKVLSRKGNFQPLCNRKAIRVTQEGVEISGNFIKAATVIWTAGVKAKRIALAHHKPVGFEPQTNRIKVTNYLNLSSYPEVFIVGDQAWICDKEHQQPYPMRAQFAEREGICAGENIWRSIQDKQLCEFEWHDKGFVLSLGKGAALARIFGLNLRGPLAWGLYRGAYLVNLFGWRAKFRTALEWIMNLFLPRDISKL